MPRLRSIREQIALALACLYLVTAATMMPAPVMLLTVLGVDVTGAGLCGSTVCTSSAPLVRTHAEPTVLEQLWTGACGAKHFEQTSSECADNDQPPLERPDTCPYSSLRVIAAMCVVVLDQGDRSLMLPPDTVCDVVRTVALGADGRVFDVPAPPPRA